MAKTRSMTRKASHVENDASGRNSGAAGLNHDVLSLVMMRLGVVDFVLFSGVCKSWRSFALSNRKKFMASRPPMMMWFSNHAYKKECYCHLEDFEGRRFKTLLPHSVGSSSRCVGLTCGYLVFYGVETKDFWLVNPITRHQLHFPDFPYFANDTQTKAILVSTPSIPGPVLVVVNRSDNKIWVSIAGKGAWNYVYSEDYFHDIHAFKGKIYTLHLCGRLYEMSLNPNPKLTLLEIKVFNGWGNYYEEFASSGENVYVRANNQYPQIVCELDFGEMKRVPPEIGECAFFLSVWKHGVAIKPESWAVDPRSTYNKSYDCFRDTSDETQKGRFFKANRWYFPHLCLDIDLINE